MTKAKAELESAKKNLAEKQAYLEKLQNISQAFWQCSDFPIKRRKLNHKGRHA
ncbi:hypothetical protein [Ligilactobacillus ruminis]|uniref:hypothetical protein n=1 Tax=Ligilactobacillus ruminis TaxID=1623 RepID=UPI000B172BCB